MTDITFEMDLNQIEIKRSGYNLFDFFSDIGGIQGLLFSGAAFFMSISNYKMLDNHLISRLYKLEYKD